MSQLQYNAVTDQLLYIESGPDIDKLARECCCDVGSPPCDCDPALDFAYDVTFSGFATASDTRYACVDNTWQVEWNTACYWVGYHSCVTSGTTRYFRIELSHLAASNAWQVDLHFTNSSWVPVSCNILWRLTSTDPCTTQPPGSYTWHASDNLCAGDADQSGTVSCSVA